MKKGSSRLSCGLRCDMEVGIRICGIPALVRVYCGHEGPERIEICDRKGYPAKWLERKMTRDDRDDVWREVWAYYLWLIEIRRENALIEAAESGNRYW